MKKLSIFVGILCLSLVSMTFAATPAAQTKKEVKKQTEKQTPAKKQNKNGKYASRCNEMLKKRKGKNSSDFVFS